MWIWFLIAFLLGGFFWWWNRQQDGMVKRDAADNARKAVEQAERTARNTTRKLKVEIGGGSESAPVTSLFDSANDASNGAPAAETVSPAETTPAPSETVPPVETETVPATSSVAEDDLTRIDGIGPKFQDVLYTAGIKTFAQLATQSEAQLLDLLKAANMRKPANLGTWATQAAFAAKGDWDGLGKYLEAQKDAE
jgi:predicted flap endonuclease-1-like 5' DNA nuclease